MPQVAASPPPKRKGVVVLTNQLPPAHGGGAIAAFRYVQRNQTRQDLRFTLLAWMPLHLTQQIPEFVSVIRRPSARRSFRWISALLIVARLVCALARLRRSHQFLHLFTATPFALIVAVPIARFLRYKVVIEHSLRGTDDPETLQCAARGGQVKDKLHYHFLLRGHVWVPKSHILEQACAKVGGPRAMRIKRIPYGVDCQLYSPATRSEKLQLRRQLDLPTDATLVLFAGGLNRRKGIHLLARSFSRIAGAYPTAHLVIVGPSDKYADGALQEALTALQQQGALSQVTLRDGFATNINDYMRACDVFCLPSEREGLPIGIIEAMASAMLVVASDIPEISSSIITHLDNGLLFPLAQPTLLDATLILALSSIATTQQMRHKARVLATEHFSHEVVDAAYTRLYGELLT